MQWAMAGFRPSGFKALGFRLRAAVAVRSLTPEASFSMPALSNLRIEIEERLEAGL
jgi:hypothetical protein